MKLALQVLQVVLVQSAQLGSIKVQLEQDPAPLLKNPTAQVIQTNAPELLHEEQLLLESDRQFWQAVSQMQVPFVRV